MVRDAHPLIELRPFGDVSELLERRRRERLTVEANLAGVGTREAEHALERRRLPRAVASEQTADRAQRNLERGIVDGEVVAVPLGQPTDRDHFSSSGYQRASDASTIVRSSPMVTPSERASCTASSTARSATSAAMRRARPMAPLSRTNEPRPGAVAMIP